MRHVAGWLVVAVGLVGCGGEETGAQPPTSGGRLKLRWFAFADGTRQPLTDLLHDVIRGEDCTPRRWDDGVERCTPTSFVLEENRFADAACTQPASVGPDRAEYGVYSSGSGDDAAIRGLFRVERAPVASLWFRDELGACRGPTSVSGFLVAGEIPRTELAEVAYTTGPPSQRIAIGAYEDADGLYMPVDAHDTELGFRCRFDAISPTEAACLSPGLGDDFIGYADDACTAPVLGISGSPVPEFASERRGCTVEVYAVGSATSHPRARIQADGRCLPLERLTDVGWFEVTRRDVATVLRTRASSDRRLAPIAFPAGGRVLYDAKLFDRESGEECTVTADFGFPDPRCRPVASASTMRVFLDASCTGAVTLAVDGGLDDCGSAAPPRFALDTSMPFAPRHRRVGALHDGPAFDITLEQCVELGSPLLPQRPRLFELGDPVADDYFVGGELVVDP